MPLLPGDDTHFVEEFSMKCPCGKTFAVGKARHPQTGDMAPAVLHEEPRCAKFEELEIDAFLRYVRMSLTN